MKKRFVVVMGVAGSGKTTVGALLAKSLGWRFYDADTFHPPGNIEKMANGIALDDDDRAPWLAALQTLITVSLTEGRPAVLACSALKESYRRKLLAGHPDILLVYLKGSYELIWSRISHRRGHYMKPDMLKSQFAALEEPAGGLTVDISLPVPAIVRKIVDQVG